MRWTDRQHTMLREMGVELWQPVISDVVHHEETVVSPAAVAAPVVPTAALPTVSSESVADTPSQRPQTAAASKPVGDAVPIAMPGLAAPPARPALDLDWPALRDAVAGCTACGLCQTRTQTVFGVGHEQAQWMVVGEAPGEQEDLRGEPFVGAAGRLLDRMLAALGLTREAAESAKQVYIANTLKCRPPRNRNPEPQELAQCLPYLERQVALVQPRVILAMGRFAVQALLGSTEPIGRLRGRVHQWQGRPLVVTYHPAYLLRQPSEKAKAWADLCLAVQAFEQHTEKP